MSVNDALMSTYPDSPVVFVRGEGSWLIDADEHRYLDLLSGLAVTSLGHSHPELARVISEQAHRLMHVSNLFGNEHRIPLAEAINSMLGSGGSVFLANSGAEANECAIKLARKWAGAGRFEVISAMGSFHGRTLATLHATGQFAKHAPFAPMPEGFLHAESNDITSFAQLMGPQTAAVLIEPIQGEGGVHPMNSSFLRALRELCTERGVLLMIDEIQTGLGRTGHWFGFEESGIAPDVVTVAKALGNGMPIGACWARAEVAAAFAPGDHGTTFGGQPLAAATARKVIELLRTLNAPERALQIERIVRSELAGVPGVVEIRGRGALLGIGLSEPLAEALTRSLLDDGVVVNAVTPTTIRVAPPLNISPQDLRLGLDKICLHLKSLSEARA